MNKNIKRINKKRLFCIVISLLTSKTILANEEISLMSSMVPQITQSVNKKMLNSKLEIVDGYGNGKNFKKNEENLNFSIDNQKIEVTKEMTNRLFANQHNIDYINNIKINNVEKENKIIKTKKEVESEQEFLKKEGNNILNIAHENSVKIQRQEQNNHYKETCWDGAAKYYNVDPWLLYSIAYVESRFNPNAVGVNKNGTKDLGMMQINDRVWLPKLARMGISKSMLKDPCVSVYVGAWILRQNINDLGYTAQAIGAYNSRTPVHNKRYAKKVYEAYAKFAKIHEMKMR